MIFAALSSVHQNEDLLFFVLLQLIIIILAARLLGLAARKLGQPVVVGEIIGGLILGPSLFQKLCPDFFHFVFQSVPSVPLQILSQIGLIFLMFQIGLEFDFSHLSERENRNAVIKVGAAGIILPFVLGYGFGIWSGPILAPGINPLGYRLFLATALSITAIPILGRIMMEFGLTKTRLGAIAITSAAINDVLGWVLLAVVSALTTSEFSWEKVGLQIGSLAAYFSACWWLGRPLLKRLIAKFHVTPHFLPLNLIAIIIALTFASGLVTYKLGIFAIFGGFLVGVLLYQEHDFVTAWKNKICDFVTAFFLPIFFTFTGLRTNVNGLDSWQLWGWCIGIIAAATIGKFLGCYLAARASGLNHHESGCLGIMMNTRALMELIVINVGYDLKVIPSTVFTMLVLMAILSTVITGPCLRLWLKHIGHEIPAHA